MKKPTALAFAVLTANMAKTYGVEPDEISKSFSVVPTVQQMLVDKMRESNAFLRDINYVVVDEIKGQKVIGAVNHVPGSRTDTSTTGERETSDILALGSQNYELHPTNFDTHMRYATMDAWAKFTDFMQRYSNWVLTARAASIIKVGWYGESAAADTDAVTNPNGEDVNIGWLEILRNYNSGAQFFSEGGTAGQIRIGPGGDFANLDTAVQSCKDMIDPMYHSDDLVAIVGDDLISDEKARLYSSWGGTPTEKERAEADAVTRIYAGLRRVRVPGFPARGLMVTALSNLSYYEQEGSERRQIIDNPKKDRVENYTSVNSGYVVENEDAAAAFEFKNVKLPAPGDTWA